MTDSDESTDDASMDMDTDTDNSSDDASYYNRYYATLLAYACEWCLRDQRGGICDGRGNECQAMASYHEAQSCARMNYICRNTIRMPPAQASLQTRIVICVQTIIN